MDRGMGRNEKKLHDEGESRTDIPGGSKERNDQMKLKKKKHANGWKGSTEETRRGAD